MMWPPGGRQTANGDRRGRDAKADPPRLRRPHVWARLRADDANGLTAQHGISLLEVTLSPGGKSPRVISGLRRSVDLSSASRTVAHEPLRADLTPVVVGFTELAKAAGAIGANPSFPAVEARRHAGHFLPSPVGRFQAGRGFG